MNADRFAFTIEDSAEGIPLVIGNEQGVRPATREEAALWRAVHASDELGGGVEEAIHEVAERGRALRARCDAIIGALDGIEQDTRALKRAVKELRCLTPKPEPDAAA